MKLIIIVWPQAVGKMSVGHELAVLTGLKFFHNHMSIDLVHHFYDYSESEWQRLVYEIRRLFFESIAHSQQKWMIFTYAWCFNLESEYEYIDEIEKIFTENHGEVYYVELEAPQEIRLERNTQSFRLEQKPTKRDTVASAERIIRWEKTKRYNSLPWEVCKKHYIRIDNSYLSPREAAELIRDTFMFSVDDALDC